MTTVKKSGGVIHLTSLSPPLNLFYNLQFAQSSDKKRATSGPKSGSFHIGFGSSAIPVGPAALRPQVALSLLLSDYCISLIILFHQQNVK